MHFFQNSWPSRRRPRALKHFYNKIACCQQNFIYSFLFDVQRPVLLFSNDFFSAISTPLLGRMGRYEVEASSDGSTCFDQLESTTSLSGCLHCAMARIKLSERKCYTWEIFCQISEVQFKGDFPFISVRTENDFSRKRRVACKELILALITGNVAFQVIEVDVTP